MTDDGPSALVIVPTHDHASTLDLAVQSALEQSVEDLDVVIIGDGVGDDTRDVVADLIRADERVRFVDLPKSPSRCEPARHEVITRSTAKIVTYLGDDDLFLPDHVAEMSSLLDDHDFAHPFPIFVDSNEQLVAYPTDLSDPVCVEWHLDPDFNTVSLSGASHTVALYRRLPHGWQVPPPGRWSDHYFWGQVFSQPGVRLVTSKRSTVVKPPASMRAGIEAVARRASLEQWRRRMARPDFGAEWANDVNEAIRRSAVINHMWTARHHRTIVRSQQS